MPVRLLALLLTAVAFAVACEWGGAPETRGTPRTTPSVQTPAPTPAVEIPSSPPTSLPECFVAERAETRDVVLQGDVDGDGAAEEVSVVVDREGAPECRAFLVVRGTEVWAAPLEVRDELVFETGLPAPSTLAEIDGRPGAEVVVTVHRGASTEFAALYTVADDELVRMHLEESLDNLVPLWGSVAHMNGADCAPDGRFVTAGATSTGPRRYRVVRTFYRPEGTDLVPEEEVVTTVRARDINSVPELGGLPFGSCG